MKNDNQWKICKRSLTLWIEMKLSNYYKKNRYYWIRNFKIAKALSNKKKTKIMNNLGRKNQNFFSWKWSTTTDWDSLKILDMLKIEVRFINSFKTKITFLNSLNIKYKEELKFI